MGRRTNFGRRKGSRKGKSLSQLDDGNSVDAQQDTTNTTKITPWSKLSLLKDKKNPTQESVDAQLDSTNTLKIFIPSSKLSLLKNPEWTQKIDIPNDYPKNSEHLHKHILLRFPFDVRYDDLENATKHLTAELSSNDESPRADFDDSIVLGKAQKFFAKISVAHYQKLFLGRANIKHMYLENDMVDMLFVWMGRNIKWNDETNVHLMNSFFYSRMNMDGCVDKALSWPNGVDIFTKTLVFIPVCNGKHYMLCVLVNPGSINANNHGRSRKISCMLYFDPKGGNAIPQGTAALVRAWLNAKWKKQNTSSEEPFTDATFRAYSPEGKCLHRASPNNCT